MSIAKTQKTIHELALDAGAAAFYPAKQSVKEQNYLVSEGFLERFAELVAAQEREYCAALIEPKNHPDDWTDYAIAKAECAQLIRSPKGLL